MRLLILTLAVLPFGLAQVNANARIDMDDGAKRHARRAFSPPLMRWRVDNRIEVSENDLVGGDGLEPPTLSV